MIIKISQTASNIKQQYEISGEGFYCQGDVGNVSRLQQITLCDSENTVKGVYSPSKWTNYIPLFYIFGKACLTRVFCLYKNNKTYGKIAFSKHGFLKNFYIMTLNSGETFYCYCRSKDNFDYVSIYTEEKQIAMLETHLSVNDYKYVHKLYISDDYNRFADILSFFVLYYASYNFVKRFHMSKGSVSERSWSYSKYNDKYNPEWRKQNFPDENFFGKNNLFK